MEACYSELILTVWGYRSLGAESGSPKKMNIVNAIAYLFWILSINIIGGNTKAIPSKFVIKVYILYISVR